MRSILPVVALLSITIAQAQVVINEVDYDQIGTDNAEYLEIKNVGDGPFPLQYLSVVFINGNGGGAAEYRTIESPSWPALAPGAYFVICGNQSLTLNCDHAAMPATNLIQNGPNDAIALVSTVDGTVFDMLSYGGDVPGFTEGTGTTAEDSNEQDGLSLSRWPDGVDTNDNDVDFAIGCPTPGEANLLDPVDCVISTGLAEGQAAFGVSMILLPHDRSIAVQFRNATAVPTDVWVYAADGSLMAQRHFGTAASGYWMSPAEGGGQLYLVRIQAGVEMVTRRVVLP